MGETPPEDNCAARRSASLPGASARVVGGPLSRPVPHECAFVRGILELVFLEFVSAGKFVLSLFHLYVVVSSRRLYGVDSRSVNLTQPCIRWPL